MGSSTQILNIHIKGKNHESRGRRPRLSFKEEKKRFHPSDFSIRTG